MKVLDDLKLRPIQMVDLRGQYAQIADEITEEFSKILGATAFIGGPAVTQFQEELQTYLNVDHIIPCANGTDALQVALMALDLKPGDEVIVPAFTFVASIEVIALLGYTPVAADVDPGTFNMNINQLESLISPRTKAIMPVHLFGQCCDMEKIMDLATSRGIAVIEDNAQSIGAEYTFTNGNTFRSGTMGQIGTLSFYPSKNLGCYGDGGALIARDNETADRLRSICNHGMTRRYYHDRIGVNSRLDALQAAVLTVKLRRLDAYCQARQSTAAVYDEQLGDIAGIRIPERLNMSSHVFHQYTIQIMDGRRDALKEFLSSKGIPSMIYYPVPLQEQEAFKGMVKTPVPLTHTAELCTRVLSLPMHTELDEVQLTYICDSIRAFMQGHG